MAEINVHEIPNLEVAMRGRRLVGIAVLSTLALSPLAASQAVVLTPHGYVADSVTLPVTPQQAADFARDVDGDGHKDNALGSVLSTLTGQNVDINAAMSEDITTGKIVMLHSLRAASLATTKNATWQVWYGAPQANPDLSGGGTFTLLSGQPHSLRIPATITDHHVRTAAGTIPVRLDIGAGVFKMTMTKAKVFATCYRNGCSSGKITGAVSMQQLNFKLMPELAQVMSAVIAADCPGQVCEPSSPGAMLEQQFDTDPDGDATFDFVITAEELRGNDLIQTVFAPDLDLVKDSGTPVYDAMSFGFGFTAVHATLVYP